MSYKLNFPSCYLCSSKDQVYYCKACNQFVCWDCTKSYSQLRGDCTHEKVAVSDNWTIS